MPRTLTKDEIGIILKNAPPGIDQAQLLQKIQAKGYTIEGAPKQGQQKSVLGFLGNVVGSGAKLVGGLAKAVTSPIQTAKALGKTALGAAELLVPGEQGQEQYARNLGQFYKERYGGAKNIGETLYSDPLGALADVSLLATGTGAALRGAGAVAKTAGLSSAGTRLGQLGSTIDPLQAIGRGIKGTVAGIGKLGKTAAQTTSAVTSGTQVASAQQVYEAAASGGQRLENVTQAIRGGVDKGTFASVVEGALDDALTGKGLAAEARKNTLSAIKKSADVTPILSKLDEWAGKLGLTKGAGGLYEPLVTSEIRGDVAAINAFNQAAMEIGRNIGTKSGRTPLALHGLQGSLSRLWSEAGAAKSAVDDLKKAAQEIIKKEAPSYGGYNEILRKYYEVQDELRQGLSLGKKASQDTVIRKIMSAFGKNSEFRRATLKKLDDLTGQNFEDTAAGLVYSGTTPEGLGRLALAGGVGALSGGLLSPYSLIALGASSPRAVGEIARALGMTAGQFRRFQNASLTLRALQASRKLAPLTGQTARLLSSRIPNATQQ